ncbi:MAG: RidA family protein [Schwartzia sp. (in: firmicutes)]
MKTCIVADTAPQAIGPYAQAVEAGGFLFVSGQIPLEPASGKMVEGGIEVQTARVLDNLQAILTAAGASLADVVKTTVYLKDMGDFARVNEVYARYFAKDCPARVCVAVSDLPKGALVEIDVVAVR